MAYGPFPFTDFEGLDLSQAADESPCIDILNVDFDRRGAIRSRPGSALYATPPNTPTQVLRMRPFYRSAGDQVLAHFAVAGGTKTTAFNAAGTVVATQAMNSASSVCDMAPMGTAAAARAYVCDSLGLMYRWDGAAFTQVAGSPKCSYVAAMAQDSRLVAANIATLPTGSGAASASSSLVHFSDAGAPETWSANNYVYVTPGDGDPITAVVAWRNSVFVFKRFRFFEFYGNSTDSSGNPIFNFRTVEARAAPQTPFSAVAAPEGVYFASGDGVYLTTGGPPQRISQPIDPFFTGEVPVYWGGTGAPTSTWADGTDPATVWGDGTGTDLWGGGGAASDMRVAYANAKLYVFRYGYSDLFVYDTQLQAWSYWSYPLANYSMTGFQFSAAGAEVLLLGQTTKIVKASPTATTDSGAVIASRYRSGFIPLNYAHFRAKRGYVPVVSQESTIRETVIDGTGTPTFSVSRDFALHPPTTGPGAKTQITLGTTPEVAQGRHRVAQRGRRVSWQLETTSGFWLVHSLTMHLRGARAPGVETVAA